MASTKPLALMAAKWFKDPRDIAYGAWLWSYKTDGMRALWDGGGSRGRVLPEGRTATGLWTKNLKVISAPDSFLDQLPPFPLDGELDAGQFNYTISIVKSHVPDNRWQDVKYRVFDAPTFSQIGRSRDVDLPHCKQHVSFEYFGAPPAAAMGCTYAAAMSRIAAAATSLQVEAIEQHALKGARYLDQLLQDALDLGHEGLVLRLATQAWEPYEVAGLLKYKPKFDAEGVVVGYTSGNITDKGSRLLGRCGAVVLRMASGNTFEIAQLRDDESAFETEGMAAYAMDNPGDRMPDWFNLPAYPCGTQVTYVFRELTPDGLPREARLKRVRLAE